MKIDLSGRTAVVTGGAAGIGRATAVLLAQSGAKVFVGDFTTDIDGPEELAELGVDIQQCDVRYEAELQRLIDRAAEITGRLDILVNNAGIAMVKPIDDVTEEDWSRCIDTNLKSAFFGAKHAVKHMRACGGGSIINMASNAGLLPRAHDPVYSISKMAIVGLTKSLGLCHAPDRIRVNCVCPGPVGDTRMMNADLEVAEDREAAEQAVISASPLAQAHARMITPHEIAQAVLYLASDAAMMVSGTSLAIDGAKSLGVPPKVD